VGNVSSQSFSRNDKYNKLSRSMEKPVPLDLWKRGELVGPVNIREDLRTEQFYLGDFGLAKRVDDPITQRCYPPWQYCSRERLHGKDPSFACDMWSYMVVFSILYVMV